MNAHPSARPLTTPVARLRDLARWRLEPGAICASGKRRYEPRLDALRGFAACMVLSGHLLPFHHEGDTSINPPGEGFAYLHLARAAVMLFFMISGFVIGLAYPAPPLPGTMREYAKRRAIRILPIYWIGIGLGICAVLETSLLQIIGNTLLLQNFAGSVDPLYGNIAVWSLHYEVIYYLAFMLIWKWSPRVLPLFTLLLLVSVIDWFLGFPFSFVGGWSVGAFFWLSGLLLAWNAPARDSRPALAPLLALYASNHLWPGLVLLNGLGLSYAGSASLGISDLFLLPGCLAVFAAVSGREFPGLRLVRVAAFAIPAGTVLILFAMGRLGDSIPWKLAAVATGAALVLLPFERATWGVRLLSLFAPIGAISYALYLFHMPIIEMISHLRRAGILNYETTIVLVLGLSFGLAWLAEKKLQPWLVQKLRPNRPTLEKTPVPCVSS
jgi:peptidoglycan/LPS O-acetylase OafA/YrhL